MERNLPQKETNDVEFATITRLFNSFYFWPVQPCKNNTYLILILSSPKSSLPNTPLPIVPPRDSFILMMR